MSFQTTITNFIRNPAQIWDTVTQKREVYILSKRGHDDVALISAKELESLLETAYLLSSSANAKRLLTALNRAKSRTETPQSVDALRTDVGLDDEEA